jgi:predicted Zn-dependent peptidase
MNRLGKQQLTTGEIVSIDEMIERFDRITRDDLERVVGSMLSDARFQVTVVGPFDEGAFDRFAA